MLSRENLIPTTIGWNYGITSNYCWAKVELLKKNKNKKWDMIILVFIRIIIDEQINRFAKRRRELDLSERTHFQQVEMHITMKWGESHWKQEKG